MQSKDARKRDVRYKNPQVQSLTSDLPENLAKRNAQHADLQNTTLRNTLTIIYPDHQQPLIGSVNFAGTPATTGPPVPARLAKHT